MGQKYTQMGVEERCEISRLSRAGQSIRQIAAGLDRAPSSIARELKRNQSQQGYVPTYAQQQARALRGGRTAQARTRNAGHQPRNHLPFHRRPDRTHQGLRLAALSAASQEPSRVAREKRRLVG